MCLGEVGCVRGVDGSDAISVDVGGRTSRVSGMLLESSPTVGEWVLVHSGFAVARLSETDAREAIELRRAAGWVG
jgi:hydrogenase expression/formation protein HypC